MSKEYYYMKDAERQGPFTIEQLEPQINPLTFVWTQGMRDWQKAKDVPELGQLFIPPVPPAYTQAPAGSKLSFEPKRTFAMQPDNSPMTLAVIITCLFAISLVLTALKDGVYLVSFATSRYADSYYLAKSKSTMFAALSILFIMSGYVCFYILLFKAWKAIPKKIARTSAGQAVGFLFIPFLNFYWVFVAFWGWCIDASRTLKNKGQAGVSALPGAVVAIFSILNAIISFMLLFAKIAGVKTYYNYEAGDVEMIKDYEFMQVCHGLNLASVTIVYLFLIAFSITMAKAIKRIQTPG